MHDELMSRREFSKSVAALGAMAALAPIAGVEGCVSLPTAESIERVTPAATRLRAEVSTPEMVRWRKIADLARLAPTPHNTQPFRIRPLDSRTAELVALGDRCLPEEDHGNRYVASAFGIFGATIELAARTLGVRVTVAPAQSIEVEQLHRATTPITLGVATIVGEMEPTIDASLLDLRRTSRIPYHDRAVDQGIWKALADIAAAHGHRCIGYDDPTIVDATLRLNVEALIDNLGLDREREEIRRWYRTGPTPQHGDGLWEIPLNQSAIDIRTAFSYPRFYRLPIVRPLAERKYLGTQRGTRHVALCCGPFVEWPDLVEAGRTLFGIWVEMAQFGIYMQPMGSMLTNPVYAAEIARRFNVTDCWLVMRVGYSDVPPRAPRFESILL